MLIGHFPHLPHLFARLIDNAGAAFPLNGLVALEDSGWEMD